MSHILLRFWLRRFALVFALAAAALILVELLASGDDPAYWEAAGWAAAAGCVAASVATYWARRHGCRLPGDAT